jgi:hypothetical protein
MIQTASTRCFIAERTALLPPASLHHQLADLDEDGIIAGNGDLETIADQLANVQA